MSKATLYRFVSTVRNFPFLVLDTETTGLSNAEIVQIALINSQGETLLDTLVKPVKPIPQAATNIHKITNEMVADAPDWGQIAPKVYELIKSQIVVIYHSKCDLDMMNSSDYHLKRTSPNWHQEPAREYLCAMNAFATFNGEWNSYRRSYTWKTLSVAAARFKVPVTNAHTALGDCLMTLGVVRGLIAAHGKGTADA